MYTDKQIKRVAEWLGYKTNNISYYENDNKTWMEITTPKGRYDRRDFRKWLVSFEGRCAIEDMFVLKLIHSYLRYYEGMEMPYAIGYDLDGHFKIWAYGKTPAKAWLDAAVNIMEKK